MTRGLMRPLRAASAALAAVALSLTACGGGDDPGGAGDSPSRKARTQTSVVPGFANDEGATRPPESQQVLAQLPRVRRPTGGGAVPNIRGTSGLTVTEFLDTIGNDVAGYWRQQFNAAGYRFPDTRQIVVTEAQAVCRGIVGATTGNAFYCPGEEAVILPVGFFQQVIDRSGDAAAAVIVGHEYGHRVEDVMGLFERRARRELTTKQLELQADCLAGTWAASVYKRGDLERGDVEEAAALMASIGDTPGTPPEHPNAHGSGKERTASFFKGFEAAEADPCKIGVAPRAGR